MANWTFLATFDGNLGWEDADETGTLAGGGTIAYTTSYWDGHQGVISNAANATDIQLAAAERAEKLDPATGAIAIRFRRTTNAANSYLLYLGDHNGTASAFVGLSLNVNAFDLLAKAKGSTTLTVLNFPAAVSAGTEYFLYVELDGTTIGASLNGAALTTTTRDAPGTWSSADTSKSVYFGSGYISSSSDRKLEGVISAVAFFDAPLTTDERGVLEDATVPWTFDMSLVPNAAPVVSAGADDSVVQFTPWTQDGSFTDATGTSWTGTVDYDDGAGFVSLTLDPDKSFTLSNTWSTTGTKDVVVRVEDDGGLIGTDTVQVTVAEGLITGAFVVSTVAGTHPTAPLITLT